MAIETVNMDELAAKTGNVYETVAIIAKRARQNAANEKAQLDDKLSYYEGFSEELETTGMQEEQARASIEFERRPKPTETAIKEMMNDEIYFRNPGEEA